MTTDFRLRLPSVLLLLLFLAFNTVHGVRLADHSWPAEEEEEAVITLEEAKSDHQLVLHSAHRRPLPPFALVVKENLGEFTASLKKITESLVWKITNVAGTALSMASDKTGIAGGIVMWAGKSVSAPILDYISWGGVAGAGWECVDAMAEMAKSDNNCVKAVQGGRFLFSIGGLALSLASLTCLAGTDLGTTAGFVAGLTGALWTPIQEGLEGWCKSKTEDDDFKVRVPVSGKIKDEKSLGNAVAANLNMQLPPCHSRNDTLLTPEAADKKYKPKKTGFAKKIESWSRRLEEDAEKPATCMRDFYNFKIGAISSYADELCMSSAWRF